MAPVILILIGPPGAGKSTIAPLLAEKCGIPDVRIADLVKRKIKEGAAEQARYISDVIAAGRTLNDIIVLNLLKERMREPECAKGMVLSDFPVSLAQAQTFDDLLSKEGLKAKFKILELFAADSVCKVRLSKRWIHEASGRTYGTDHCKPKSMTYSFGEGSTMKDDVTGEELCRMQKDTVYEIPKQLFVYHLGAEPVLEHFGRIYCTRIDASQTDLTKIVADCMSYLNRTIFYEAPIAEALKDAPLPQESNALEAETRVYARGDFLERRVYAPPATRLGEKFGPLVN